MAGAKQGWNGGLDGTRHVQRHVVYVVPPSRSRCGLERACDVRDRWFYAILGRFFRILSKGGTGPPVSSGTSKQKRNRILSWLINAAGLLFFGLILYFGGVEAWQQITQADWQYVLAAFAITLLGNMAAAFRWSLIAEVVIDAPEPTPYRYYFTYQMIGMLIGQVVPTTVGMLGGRPTALSLSRGIPFRRAALSVVIDKAFDLYLALLLAGPVALFLVGWLNLPLTLALMGAMVIIGGLLLGWRYEQGTRHLARITSRLAAVMARVPVIGRGMLRRLSERLDRLARESVMSNRLAVQAYLVTLVVYGLLSMRLFLIAQALQLEIPAYLLVMGLCITQLAVVFAVTPGSLGFLEGGWAAVFTLAGLSREQFFVFVIGRRAFVLVFTLLDTLLAFVWIRESPAHLFRAVLEASRQPAAGDAQNGSPTAAVK
ncbi:lysylphosphatidylglycerol synthase transmembrane domain-containing protein [Chloroflexota bacterium]